MIPATYAKYDINADGQIDATDVEIVVNNLFGFYDQMYRDSLNFINNAGSWSVGRNPLLVLIMIKDPTLTPWNNFEINDIYQPGDTFNMPGGNVTLTAQWVQNKRTVTYPEDAENSENTRDSWRYRNSCAGTTSYWG